MDTNHPELQDKLQELEHELEVSGGVPGSKKKDVLYAMSRAPICILEVQTANTISYSRH